jgi:regulator of sigma E protease
MQWGETEYGIGILPLGGYVKMFGQDDNPHNAESEADSVRVKKGDVQDGAATKAAPAPRQSAGDDPDGKPETKADADEWVYHPRSYPAKTVPQRMLIISAGVVMNLITGAMMAAAAYMLGVSYTPCEVAALAPGDPAWVAGIRPGDKIIQIGRDGNPDEHLRFTWEMTQKVVRTGFGGPPKPIDIKIRRNGEEFWIAITPTERHKTKERPFVSIGVVAPNESNRLRKKKPVRPDTAAAMTEAFKGGDRIVAINGARPSDRFANEIGDLPGFEFNQLFSQYVDEEITVTVERTTESGSSSEVDIQVPPQPRRMSGLEMKIGPVYSVREKSAAEEAGFKKGDVIRTIDGGPVGDPLTLTYRITPRIGEAIQFEVERDGETVMLTATPRGEELYAPGISIGPLQSIETLGLSFSIKNEVASVAPDSPAADAQFQPGDRLTKYRYIVDDDKREAARAIAGKKYDHAVELSERIYNWSTLNDQMQLVPDYFRLELTYERDGTTRRATVKFTDSDEYFMPERGFRFARFERIHTAESFGDACSLGYREIKEKLTEVVDIIYLLATGKVSIGLLGGPIMIASMAGSEASIGWARLLLFLTLLSGNLAILNFLPIPALDGGHFVFLAWEGLSGKPVDERLQEKLTIVGVLLLLLLMVVVFSNDIQRIFL